MNNLRHKTVETSAQVGTSTDMTSASHNHSRRRFLQSTAGLTLTVYLNNGLAVVSKTTTEQAAGAAFAPNAFLKIATDNSITVIAKHLEMGQGSHTGLATLVAEELDADWAQIRIEGAPADAKRFNNLFWGPTQGTGGSTAMANSWQQMRQAGATARAMLVAAAAEAWRVPIAEIRVSEGLVTHTASGHKANFGQLAAAAARQKVPGSVPLKDAKNFKLIGKHVPRKDAVSKIKGQAQFTQDVHLSGMLTALVAHPPRFGSKVKSFEAKAALAVKGVVRVVQIPSGVAVLAQDTWSAKKGRDALTITWDDSAAMTLSSSDIFARYHKLAQSSGMLAKKIGDAETALATPARVLRAAYDFPYLAHAAMEPMNCVVQLTDGACDIWNGEQFQTVDQMKLAALLGLPPEKVRLHMLFAGGSFGRRASTTSDYLLEAANIAKAIEGKAPIKLVWLREDDMRAGYYRPAFHHTLEAAVDKAGQITAWRHRLVGQSILAGSPFAGMIKEGIDAVSVEGAANLPYAIANMQVELHSPADIGVPVLWWRSVGSTHTAYSTETFIDEIAATVGQDPLTYRLALLNDKPRHVGVLKLAAAKAAWGQPLRAGKSGERRGRGIAVHESFNTFVAQVAEVTVGAEGSVRVDRIVCAVDCGIAINPDNVRAQVEGSIGFALSALLHGAITFKDGIVEQSNFYDYAPIRINEMPQVDVHIMPSAEAPTGIGEPAVPPLAPAVVNAIAAATGKRVYSLPIDTQSLKA